MKKEYILLAVVILVLAGYLFFKKTNRLHYTLPATPVLAQNDIVKLAIEKGDRQTLLTKKDGTWFIAPGDYPADPAKVDKILSDIHGMAINTLVSESGDYLRYDLTEDKKIAVKVFGKKGLLFSFAVGKRAATFQHTFVMLEGDKRVFQSQGNFRSDFEQGPQDLRDKNVLPFVMDTLASLEITEDGKVLSLKKKAAEDKKTEQKAAETPPPAGWVDSSGRDIPEAAMNELFSQLSGLQCESYLDGKKKEDFKDPNITIELQGKRDETLSIFTRSDKKDNGNPAITSASATPFILQKFKVDLIRKAVKDIRSEKNEAQAGPTIPKDAEQKK